VAGLSYTAYVQFVANGNTYRIEKLLAARAADDSRLTYSGLCVAIADFLGFGRDDADWSTETDDRLSDIIHSGYLQFLYPPILSNEATAHRWSFLRPSALLATVADDYLYDMPTTFGSIVGDMIYAADANVARVIKQTSPGYIDRQRSISDANGRPAFFALRPKTVDETGLQITECMLWPTPDAVYSLAYHYDAHVSKLSATNLYPLGGQAHAEAIIQSCRDIAAQRYKDQPAGPEHELFMQRLQASVEADRRNSPSFLGYNRDSRSNSYTRHGADFRCTLKHNLGGG
jgi:hypothetical protein